MGTPENTLEKAPRERVPVAVVDDHEATRLGVQQILERSGRYRVAVQAAHGGELVRALEEGAVVAAAIVDLSMPVMDGYAALEWLRAHRPQVRNLAYTFEVDEAVVVRSYRSGAHGLVLKAAPHGDLLAALDTVLSGGIYHTAYSQQVLLDNPDGRTPEERRRQRILAQLTPRQVEVLTRLCRADDPTYERMGQELGVGRRTVETHISELFAVFGVRSKTALVLAAVRVGAVEV